MQLAPRYDGRPPLSVEVQFPDPSVPLLRQRRRLADILDALELEQWTVASRCSGWSVHDVVSHLVGVNRFWALSVRSARAGNPTRLLVGFDPVATPRLMVEPMHDLASAAVLDDFIASVDDLADALDGVDDGSWSLLAEAPPGHIALRAVALHALWDGWVHERDIVLPLGLTPVEQDDEVTASLLYAAVLGPALLAAVGVTRSGTLAVHAEHPTVRFVIDAGETVVVRQPGPADADVPRLEGPAVEMVEGLSRRIPLRHELSADNRWLVEGLAEVFDPTPA